MFGELAAVDGKRRSAQVLTLEESLLAVATDAKLCLALETLLGFVEVADDSLVAKKKSVTSR